MKLALDHNLRERGNFIATIFPGILRWPRKIVFPQIMICD